MFVILQKSMLGPVFGNVSLVPGLSYKKKRCHPQAESSVSQIIIPKELTVESRHQRAQKSIVSKTVPLGNVYSVQRQPDTGDCQTPVSKPLFATEA